MAPKPLSLPRGRTALFVPTVCIRLLASRQDGSYRVELPAWNIFGLQVSAPQACRREAGDVQLNWDGSEVELSNLEQLVSKIERTIEAFEANSEKRKEEAKRQEQEP